MAENTMVVKERISNFIGQLLNKPNNIIQATTWDELRSLPERIMEANLDSNDSNLTEEDFDFDINIQDFWTDELSKHVVPEVHAWDGPHLPALDQLMILPDAKHDLSCGVYLIIVKLPPGMSPAGEKAPGDPLFPTDQIVLHLVALAE
jgi:hypothetical protein